jgi:hypothetical protein
VPRAGLEPAIPARERLQTHLLDRAATGIGYRDLICSSLYNRAPDSFTSPNSKLTLNAAIKSVRATLPDEIFLLGILLLEPCVSLIYSMLEKATDAPVIHSVY